MGALSKFMRLEKIASEFSIEDKGIGIPKADLPTLFQSFHRGSNIGTIPGTGLGLAIAKACVELHGGEIKLSSRVGTGTKVTVSLPKRPLLEPSDVSLPTRRMG